MPHHYIESGLDHVFLENGYRLVDTPYGKGLTIHDVGALHSAIAQAIIAGAHSMTGAELRFLRLEMDLTQTRLARLLGTEEQTLRRWEKARTKPVPGPADRMLRALYSEYAGHDGSIRRMVERLAAQDNATALGTITLRETRKGWRLEALA